MEKKTKKNLITYLIIAGSCLAVGGVAGVIGKRVLGQEIVDDSSFNPKKFEANVDEIYSRYLKYTGTNITNDFSTSEIINIALEKYRRCENSYSMGIGVAYAEAPVIGTVEQAIRSAQVKNGDKYFEESSSKSTQVQCAVRTYQEGKDGELDSYKGSSVSSNAEKATYSNDFTHYTHKNYKKTWGKTLDEMFIYIISNKTILKVESFDKKTDSYVITIDLNPDTSTYYYKTQMVTISELDSRPVFSKEKLTFTLSKELNLIHLRCEEAYEASKFKFTAPTTATIDYYYYPNGYYEIPSYNQPIDYSLVKGGN